MSKQIYTLKIALLSDQIEICEVEEVEADEEADNETNRRRKKVKKFKSMKITTEEKTKMKDIVSLLDYSMQKHFLRPHFPVLPQTTIENSYKTCSNTETTTQRLQMPVFYLVGVTCGT